MGHHLDKIPCAVLLGKSGWRSVHKSRLPPLLQMLYVDWVSVDLNLTSRVSSGHSGFLPPQKLTHKNRTPFKLALLNWTFLYKYWPLFIIYFWGAKGKDWNSFKEFVRDIFIAKNDWIITLYFWDSIPATYIYGIKHIGKQCFIHHPPLATHIHMPSANRIRAKASSVHDRRNRWSTAPASQRWGLESPRSSLNFSGLSHCW